MGGAGLIYAAIVAAWAAYLVPMWLRRHEERAEARSVDRFSAAMRVLARRTPAPHPAVAVEDAAAAEQPVRRDAPVRRRVPDGAPVPVGRAAARRRRRLLTTLTVLLVLTGTAAGLTGLPGWTVAVPGLLLTGYLVLLVLAGRRAAVAGPAVPVVARTPTRSPRPASVADSAPVPAGLPAVEADWAAAAPAAPAAEAPAAPAAVPTTATAAAAGAAPGDAPAEHVLRAGSPAADAAPAAFAAPVDVIDAHHLSPLHDPDAWQPVPVPLPTYVTAPKAPRAIVRTIDLSSPGAWTSGPLDEAEPGEPMPVDDLPEWAGQTTGEGAEADDVAHRRAVGD